MPNISQAADDHPCNSVKDPTPQIPSDYQVSQAIQPPGELTATKGAAVFSFMMPDGTAVAHDYGLEGLPNVKSDQERYPVIVNEIQSDPLKIQGSSPERQLANLISSYSLSGLDLHFKYGAAEITTLIHPSIWQVIYYMQISPQPDTIRGVSAILFCVQHTLDVGNPSACHGWEYSEGLGMMLRVRFPRLKVPNTKRLAR